LGYVTKEMIEQARKTPVLDYILANESDAFKRVGHGYRHKEDNALALSDRGWYHHKQNIGSKTALDYLIEIKGYSLINAVCEVLGEIPLKSSLDVKYKSNPKDTHSISKANFTSNNNHFSQTNPYEASLPPPKQIQIKLPRRNKDNKPDCVKRRRKEV